MKRYVVSLGSNIASAKEEIDCAIEYLKWIFTSAQASSVYTSPSIKGDGVIYHNAVLSGYFSADAVELNRLCKDYEARRGRLHTKGAPVVIDIDVIIADDTILRPVDYAQDYFARGYNELS